MSPMPTLSRHLSSFEIMRVLLLGTALIGIICLAKPQRRNILGKPGGGAWLLAAPFAGALIYGLNLMWVDIVRLMNDHPILGVGSGLTLWGILLSPLLVSYSEELIFRGVLWAGIEHVAKSKWALLFQTSLLFAILHLLDGSGLWYFPHRFAAGLILGWIRLKSGSLWPCMHAHFVTNLITAIHV